MFQKFEVGPGASLPSTARLLPSSAETDGEFALKEVICETHATVDASRILCVCNDLALMQRTRPDEIKVNDKDRYKEWALNWLDTRST